MIYAKHDLLERQSLENTHSKPREKIRLGRVSFSCNYLYLNTLPTQLLFDFSSIRNCIVSHLPLLYPSLSTPMIERGFTGVRPTQQDILFKLADAEWDGKRYPPRNVRARLQVRGEIVTVIGSQIAHHSSTPSFKWSLQYTPGTLASLWHGCVFVSTFLLTCSLYLIVRGLTMLHM